MTRMTAKRLREDMKNYFEEISRKVELKESVPTGQKDEKGREIYAEIAALNGKGEPVMVEQWLVPPSIPDLLNRLKLTPAEWVLIKADRKLGSLAVAAEAKIERYLRRELLTRPGKDLKGVILMLQNDFGFGGEAAEEDGGTLEELLGDGGA